MTARKGGLGRGLAALITNQPDSRLGDNAADIVIGGARKPEPDAEETPTSAALRPQLEVVPETELAAHYQEIPTDLIDPNPKNPRKVFDNFDLDELVHSIKEFGLLQPIVVRRSGDRYELVMGERRWRAATQAGLDTIPAIVRKTDDDSMLRDALLENVHRVQLNPLEEAAAYEQLLEEFGVTQSELADKLGRSRPVVTNNCRLLCSKKLLLGFLVPAMRGRFSPSTRTRKGRNDSPTASCPKGSPSGPPRRPWCCSAMGKPGRCGSAPKPPCRNT